MNIEKAPLDSEIDENTLTDADKWILSKVNALIKEASENLEIMIWEWLVRKFMILYGKNSVIGILKWLNQGYTVKQMKQSFMDFRVCTNYFNLNYYIHLCHL